MPGGSESSSAGFKQRDEKRPPVGDRIAKPISKCPVGVAASPSMLRAPGVFGGRLAAAARPKGASLGSRKRSCNKLK